MDYPPAMSIVEVTWADSASYGTWRPVEEWDEALTTLHTCLSAGYLYRATDTDVVLMQSQGDTAHLSDAIQIPAFAVQRVRWLSHPE